MADQKDKNEMTAEELEHRAKSLYDAGKYDEVISLLDDELLAKHNKAELYNYKGMSWHDKQEYDKAVDAYNIGLKIDNNVAFLANRAASWAQKKQYEKAIHDCNEAIRQRPDIASFYFNRAFIYSEIGDNDKAIQDYNKAIELDPNNIPAYNKRALTWAKKKEYHKSIEDFTTVIKLNPEYTSVYYNRANSWHAIGEYNKAIEDYDRAIVQKPDQASAYNNRGVSWDEIGEHEKALNDYSKALILDPKHASAYNNRGVIRIKKKEYELALADFNTAVKLDPDYTTAKENRDELNAQLGKDIELDESSTSPIQLFARILEEYNVKGSHKKNILKICAKTRENPIGKIRAHAGSNIEGVVTDNRVAHYTKLKVADILATSEKPDSKLRYYNAIYMNDPEEGAVLLSCMDESIRECYEKAAEQEEDNIYIGSFLSANRHEDELVMWRTYGKDEQGVEGAGCSIVINTDFFEKFTGKGGSINPEMSTKDGAGETALTPQCLFRVLYYNKRHNGSDIQKFNCNDGGKIEKDVEELNSNLKRLMEYKTELPEDCHEAIDKLIYHLLSEVRFFFKSADYEFENEVRVLQFVPKNSDLLLIDDLSHPKRVYIESNKAIQPHIEKIILGPKVPNPKQWMYLDVALRKQNPHRSTPIDVSISECRYQ